MKYGWPTGYPKIIYVIFALAFAGITLWGCTVQSKKLRITALPQSFEPGTIVSTKQKRAVPFDSLLPDLMSVKVIYIGESHPRAAHHDIQLQIIRALYAAKPGLVIAMEMFDRSYQPVLDQWTAGELTRDQFIRKVQWYANWRYDFGLYEPILNFVKDKKLKLLALNIPSYIPARIRVGGIENLLGSDRRHLPTHIDTGVKAHREYVRNVYQQHHFHKKERFEDFYAAQCVWEDAMAETIFQNSTGDAMVVLTGNGHIIKKYGIPNRAARLNDLPFRTIYQAPADEKIELDVADYIWITPSSAMRPRFHR